MYKFSHFVQRNDSPIDEEIPALLIMFEDLKNLKINEIQISGNIAKLRDQLINAFKKKFHYELESNIFVHEPPKLPPIIIQKYVNNSFICFFFFLKQTLICKIKPC